MSGFFIDRIRFAVVVSLVIVIVGVIALISLPVQQYPNITPPTVNVSASYPGADSETIANVVAGPIETAVNGVDDMLYMSSTSSSAGQYSLSIVFAVGTDTDIAQVNVQNAVQRAIPTLPTEVVQQGVTVGSRSPDFILAIALVSPDRSLGQLEIANYATTRVVDPIVRVDGVGDAAVVGASKYSMRVWLDSERLNALDISSAEVIGAIRAQNTQASLGTVAAPPAPEGSVEQFTIVGEGRLTEVAQFEDIIVRRGPDGALVRLSDIARIELGLQSYNVSAQVGGEGAAMIQINQAPGANALATRRAVLDQLDSMAESFPEGLEYQIIYDATLFVSSSVNLIMEILVEAFVMVMLIVFLFLSDWRATVVAALVIPVSLLGAMAMLLLLGYSLNTVSLLALILAIGLVVDDAILVVENVQHVMEKNVGIGLRDAARKSMGQITGPIVSTTLVLLAVVAPTAFLPGINGQLFRQFAVTVGSALAISSLVALTLCPALAATLMRKPKPGGGKGILSRIGGAVDWARVRYGRAVGAVLRVWYVPLAALAACFAAAGWLFVSLPSTFLPDEDQGALFVNIQLPDAASLSRTQEIVDRVARTVAETQGVDKAISVSGFSILQGTESPNGGMIVASLKSWGERSNDDQQIGAIINKLNGEFAAIPGAIIGVFAPPSIPGIGAVDGLDLRLQALAGQPPEELAEVLRSFIVKANQAVEIGGLQSTFSATVPQVYVDIDRTRAARLGLAVSDIYDVIGASFGSRYVNDFTLDGRVYQVNVSADADDRATIDDILKLEAPNDRGEMAPLRTVVKVTDDLGPYILQRYNLYTAAPINGQPAADSSSGAAMAAVARVASEALPDGYDFAWAGLSLQQAQSSGDEILIFGVALLFGYLFLVALYESWMLPVAIVLSLGTAAFGAMAALWLTGMATSLYVQIALVLLIGLAAKNAILIVEFARDRSDGGEVPMDAARNGAEARFRAVMMTSLSFVFGLVPLIISSGAGAGAQNAIGVTVIGGMLGVTVIGLFVIPALYYAIQSIRERFHRTNRKGELGAAG